jgi:hypothetical protein
MLDPDWGIVHSADSRNLMLLLIWGRGEIDSFVKVYANQEEIHPAATSIGIHNYLGTNPGTTDTDSWLTSPTWGIPGFSDTVDDICHSVILLDAKDTPNIPRFQAHIKGLKLYDPRTTTTVFTRNPALMYRHAALEMGLNVDDDLIEDTADACDTLVNGIKRRQCGIAFKHAARSEDVLQTLAEYAGAFHYLDGDTAKLIPDRPASVSMSFTWDETDGTKKKVRDGSFKLAKKSIKESPNYCTVEYTDTSVYPWRRAFAYPPSFPSGTVIRTNFPLPGIQSYAEANRARIERQNRYDLTDLEISFTAFDEATALEVGDIIDFDTDDLSEKEFRIMGNRANREIGQNDLLAEEYDPAVYSDEHVSDPTYPDHSLPDPDAIPTGPDPDTPLDTVGLVERLWTDEGGKTYSVFDIQWTGVDWFWARYYRVRVYSGNGPLMDQLFRHEGTGETHIATTPPVAQDIQYTIEISIINPANDEGAPSSNTKTGDGKALLPTNINPASMTSLEFGQVVWLEWGEAVDTDLDGYRIKRLSKTDYDAASDDDARWNHANVVQLVHRHDSTQIQLPMQPEGTYMYGVKALDSIPDHESVLAAWIEQEVTVDQAGSISVLGLRPNLNIFSSSFDATDSSADAWNYDSITAPTKAKNAVGLSGKANTASTITDGNASFTLFTGTDQTLDYTPRWHSARAYIRKDVAATKKAAFSTTTNDPSTGALDDGLSVLIDPSDGAVTANWDNGVDRSQYLWDSRIFTSGGYDWIEVVMELCSADPQTRLRAYISPAGEAVGDTASVIVGGVELLPKMSLYEVLGSNPMIIANAATRVTNMWDYEQLGVGRKMTSARNTDTLADRFGAESTDWSTKQSEPWNYGFTFASGMRPEDWDTEDDRSGNWAFSAVSATPLGGATITLQISVALLSAYPTFTNSSGNSVQAEARFMRPKYDVASALNHGMTIQFPCHGSYKGEILSEVLTINVPESGQPYAFTWASSFTQTPDFSPSLIGDEPILYAFENVDKDGGDVRAWAATGHSTITAGDPADCELRVSATGS